MARILVVDDELRTCELLAEVLVDAGHTVTVVHRAEAACAAVKSHLPELALLAVSLSNTTGVELLKEWRNGQRLQMPVVMLTVPGAIESAIAATRLGATDILEKPICLQKLLRVVQSALNGPTFRDAPRDDAAEFPHCIAQWDSVRFDLPFREARESFECLYFEKAMNEHGCMPQIAAKAGIDRAHLYRKLRQLGLSISHPSV